METEINKSQIVLHSDHRLELTKYMILLAYIVLETLYQTIFGMYFDAVMDKLQCICAAALVCLLIFEWIRLDRQSKANWLKKHTIVFVYFIIRGITLVSVGFAYTMIRSLLFEVVYLLVFTELILRSSFCRKVAFKFFIWSNLILNIFNAFLYIYCERILAAGTDATDIIYEFANNHTYMGEFELYNYCSMYSNPNQMGIMTSLAMIIVLNYLTREMSIYKKVATAFYYVFGIYCLWISNCSSALVGIAAAIGAFAITKMIKMFTKKKTVVLVLLCAVLATCVIYGIVATHDDTEAYSEFENQLDSLSTRRYTIWKDSYYSHKDELLLGCGNMTLEKRDRYQYNLDKGINPGFDISGSLVDYVGPHNGYVGMVSCTGILGFLAYLLVLLKKVKDSKSLNMGCWYLAIVFILTINLFECLTVVSKNVFCMCMFLIISMEDREVNL